MNDKESTAKSTVKENTVGELPEWARNANIYEVNIRQFSPEGTFEKVTADLPRLSEMGVDILWLMPVFPISETNRKGGLGSYYAVSDFRSTNPEFGTIDDVKQLIAKAHSLNMRVILDWVPNHTGWDHVWMKENKDFYTQNEKGEVIDPVDPNTGKSNGWTDVADLNYDNPEMRKTMIEDLSFWVKEIDVDGFRMDVAYLVPNDFWKQVATRLYALKPIFMLAESETPEHANNKYFHATYAWTLHHLMNDIAKGKKKATEIDKYLVKDAEKFKSGFHMVFTSNHDENSWAGTVFERMGDAHKTFAVLAGTIDGMPLIYSGQEAPLNKRLRFFEKDTIDWGSYEYSQFYNTLLTLKKNNKALWNGEHGGKLQKMTTNKDDSVYAFLREKNGDKVVVILNLSKEKQEVTLSGDTFEGAYQDVFNNRTMSLVKDMGMSLSPWAYVVLSGSE